MRAVAYYRNSTVMQSARQSTESQKMIVRKYAREHSIVLVREYCDEAVSGMDNQRSQFNEMLQNLNDVDAVIAFDMSRLSRDMSQSLSLILMLQNQGKRLILVHSDKSYDLCGSNDTLAMVVQSYMAVIEREKIQTRIKAGVARTKERLGRWGRPKIAIDLDAYHKYKSLGYTDAKAAALMKISSRTLRRRLREQEMAL